MDPVSLAASIITLVGAARAVTLGLNRLGSFYGVSALLNSLKDEISGLCVVLGQIERGIVHLGTLFSCPIGEVSRSGQQPIQLLESILQNAQNKILQLRLAVESCLKDTGDGKAPRVRKLVWIRQQPRIEQLRKEIFDIRVNLIMALTALNMLQSARIAYHVESFVAESSKPNTTSVENVDPAVESVEEINKAVFQNSPAPLSQFWNASTKCTYLCNCSCHRLGRFCTPDILRSIVGSILIDYSGIPILNSKCDSTTCSKIDIHSSLRVSYYFPRWFLARMVSAILSYNVRDGPELSYLRTPHVRPADAEVFLTARNGEVMKMRQLLAERSASPFDVDVNGYSALFVAVVYANLHRNSSIIKLLLDAGADPYAHSHFQSSPFDAAWDRIFSKTADPEISSMLSVTFNDTSKLNERHLSQLHKKVLGVSENCNWSSLVPSLDIDAIDSNGRTALHWAANQGDYDAVCAILRCGADPNMEIHPPIRIGVGPSDEGRTVVHCASQMHNDDPRIIHALLKAGANVKVKDVDQKTPLFIASYNSNPLCLDALLHHGADINAQDEEGFTPLLGAIAWNNHESIRILIRRGANLLKVTEDGWNIWNWTIACGDVETLRILANIPVFYPDSIARPPINDAIQQFSIERSRWRGSCAYRYYQIDPTWHSALELMMSNLGVNKGVITASQSLRFESIYQHQNEDSENEDCFVDAWEYVPVASVV